MKNGAVSNLRACMLRSINKDTYLARQPRIPIFTHKTVPHSHLISTIHTYIPVEMYLHGCFKTKFMRKQ